MPMKPNRQIWIWAIVEIFVALVVHWLLLESERKFAGTRAWWARFNDRKSDWPNPPAPSSDVPNPLRRN